MKYVPQKQKVVFAYIWTIKQDTSCSLKEVQGCDGVISWNKCDKSKLLVLICN